MVHVVIILVDDPYFALSSSVVVVASICSAAGAIGLPTESVECAGISYIIGEYPGWAQHFAVVL